MTKEQLLLKQSEVLLLIPKETDLVEVEFLSAANKKQFTPFTVKFSFHES